MSASNSTQQDRTTAPKPRRWLASVIAATSAPDAVPGLPFQRGVRRRPASLATPSPRPQAIAAR
jgi:hypothetical protein